MTQLNLSQFKLRRAVFEVRYPNAYQLWDRAGDLWREATRRWGGLDVLEAQPGSTVFRHDTKRTELSAQLKKTSIVRHYPDNFDDFVEMATDFLNITKNTLEIYEYERVGLRLIYYNSFPDKAAASNAMIALDLMKIPSMPQFSIDGAAILPEYAVRFEDDKKGATVRIKAESEKQEFKPPLNMDELKPVEVEKTGVTFDVDYFTTVTISVAQFRAKDWIEGAHHVIRRGSKSFFGG